MKTHLRNQMLLTFFLVISACQFSPEKSKKDDQSEAWISIFNGENLDGWIPKIAGDSAGVNTLNVFRVEDGILKVSYDQYNTTFNDRYGHLFYKHELSHYKLRVEYRFVGELLPDAKTFCYLNSGVMIHSQSPESMLIDQSWPVSLETQFLGSNDSVQNCTANLCTPGTTVWYKGKFTTDHIIQSNSDYFYDDEWVTVEIVVRGSKSVTHIIAGDTVLHCTNPQIGGSLLPDNYPLPEGTILDKGYIALQAEGQPIEFRKVELMILNE